MFQELGFNKYFFIEFGLSVDLLKIDLWICGSDDKTMVCFCILCVGL